MVKKRASNSDGVGGPIGPQQLYAAAKAALSMARTILESLPIKSEARLKSDINVIDQWFQSAGEDYTTFERIRNPERLPWPGMGLGTYHVAAPSSKAVAHFHELCEAMARICESYQWQGISDGSRIPHSMQRYGTALIPEVNVAFVCSVAIAAQGLSEDLNPTDTDGRQWVGNLVAAAETLARAEANIEPPKPVEPQAKTRESGAGAGDGQLQLKPCEGKAWSQYQKAFGQNAELTTDRQAYDWFVDEIADDAGELPSFASWSRYLRAARKAMDQGKNGPRIGNETRSVVSVERIERPRKRIEADR